MAIVCHCSVVRERTIVKAIRRGAGTLEEVKAACGAGTSCGGCHDALCRLIDEHAGCASAVSVSGSFAAQ
ncbi:MAG: (2Fe-2S)-binding protein [Actinomycetota bacterium]|nr:(2Fe-2S)-binding protein [Actinomycetota bacterium]